MRSQNGQGPRQGRDSKHLKALLSSCADDPDVGRSIPGLAREAAPEQRRRLGAIARGFRLDTVALTSKAQPG